MIRILSVLFISFGFISYSYAGAICWDGWISKSSGSGTCSSHGGVREWIEIDLDSFDDDGFIWDDEGYSEPCKKRNPSESKKQCLEKYSKSPFNVLNNYKRIMEKNQDSDDFTENLKKIIQNSN